MQCYKSSPLLFIHFNLHHAAILWYSLQYRTTTTTSIARVNRDRLDIIHLSVTVSRRRRLHTVNSIDNALLPLILHINAKVRGALGLRIRRPKDLITIHHLPNLPILITTPHAKRKITHIDPIMATARPTLPTMHKHGRKAVGVALMRREQARLVV